MFERAGVRELVYLVLRLVAVQQMRDEGSQMIHVECRRCNELRMQTSSKLLSAHERHLHRQNVRDSVDERAIQTVSFEDHSLYPVLESKVRLAGVRASVFTGLRDKKCISKGEIERTAAGAAEA